MYAQNTTKGIEMADAILVGGQILKSVHDGSVCAGRPCPIHNISDHSLKYAVQRWNSEKGCVERQCDHMKWHPDPDDITIHTEHKCCGQRCCNGPTTDLDITPDCRYGFSDDYLRANLSDAQYKALKNWMHGQTIMLCDGRRYNYETKEYEPSECGEKGEAHGAVLYTHDVNRWANRLPVID